MQLLSAVIVLCALAGLALHLAACDRDGRRRTFLFYTNLSNLLTALFHIARLTGLFPALEAPSVRLMLMLCILVTGIVYWALLAPHEKRNGETIFLGRASSLLLHGAVPALALCDWLLFADKALRIADAFYWLVIPAAYCIFIFVRAPLCGPLPGRSTAYPYHFMNPKKLGWGRFFIILIAMTAGFLLLGLAFVYLSRLLP